MLEVDMINFHHLDQVEETYFQHFKFALWAAGVFLVLGIVSLIHAVFPFVFSRTPDKIYRYFVKKSEQRISRVNNILKEKKIE
jgi:hypothetical protein